MLTKRDIIEYESCMPSPNVSSLTMTNKQQYERLYRSDFAASVPSPPQTKFRSLLFWLLIFGFGLSFGFVTGVIASFALKSFPNYISAAHFSSFPSSPPPESPPPCPPQAPPLATPPPPSPTPDKPLSNGLIDLKDYLEPRVLMHHMDDKELLWRASMSPRVEEYPYNRTPKIAFMFLTKGDLPLSPLWERFFKGHEGLYSLYVHCHPQFNKTVPENSAFYRRRIPSKEVLWGEFNMIEAERRLLANALLDFSNQYFILLSESCVPLYNFSTVYAYLMNTTQTFVQSYDAPGKAARGRYNRAMDPDIKMEQWRKGSQWFEMDRRMAVEVVADRAYLPVYRKHCNPPCYVDEHYLPTLANIRFWRSNANRTITYVDWSSNGAHPVSFGRNQVTKERLMEMKNGTECEYNGQKTRICYLFARKFVPDALDRLLPLADEVLGIR